MEKSAEVVAGGTDREVYGAGDRPLALVEIRNNGDKPIKDATITLTVTRKTALGSITLVKDKMFKASNLVPGFSVPAGKSRRFEVSPFQIPDSSLAKGTYELKADILVDGRSIGAINKTIKVR